MSEPMGIDMPEFQLSPDRREYLREHGTMIESVNEAGKKVYEKPVLPSTIVDEDGTIIYLGLELATRRENGMRVIEQTPQWILRAIMQHAKRAYAHRDNAIWPETKWTADYAIREVFITFGVDDDAMPKKLRQGMLNYGKTLVSRFLVRENPEYAETGFITIRRPKIKRPDDEEDPDQMELDIIDRKKEQLPVYCLDDYLFPELKGLTADAVTAPGE